MSLDMPFYEELRRRGHPAARSWLIGDCLYYIGLLAAMLGLVGLVLSPLAVLAGWLGWSSLLVAAGALVGGVCVFLVGVASKGRAYRLAARDGIHVDDY